MKKTLLAALCLLCFTCLKAQVVTTGHITTIVASSATHDSTYCQSTCTYTFTVTIDTASLGDVVNVVDTFSGMLLGSYTNTTGASPWTFIALPAYASSIGDASLSSMPGMIHFYSPPFKIVYHTDTQYILPYDSLFVPDPCEYGMVSGDVYIDANSNCIHDIGEPGLGPYELDIMDNVSSPVVTIPFYISSSGPGSYMYEIQKSWMTSYTVSLPAWYSFIFGTPPCYTPSGPYTTLPMTGIDFPLLCTSNVDLECDMLSPVRVRAHMPFFLHPYVNNTGCDTIGGQLTLIKDSRAIYNAGLSTYPADAVYGDTLVWNYYGLSNVSGGAYWSSFLSSIHLTPDTSVTSGDTLCFRVYTGIPGTDINPSNNAAMLCLPVVYSFDPNIKEVSPVGEGPLGNIPPSADTLTYTLHFQNTGTAAAYDIKVIDTLDGDINPASLKIMSASHTMYPKWLTPNVIQFTFDNIMLPDSTTNEPASHGSVKFSVALDSGLPLGTQIRNKGYIYFDLNPPVITNGTLNTIALPSAVQNIAAAGSVKVYPNPATDRIYVESNGDGDVYIMGMNGAVIATQKLSKGKTSIDISAMPAGMYMVKTVNDANTQVARIAKY